MTSSRSEPPSREMFGEGVGDRGGTILVVDDDDALRRLVQGILDRAGYSVIQAAGGRDAIRRVEDRPIDLVLLDVGMPDVDGIQVCTEIRRSYGSLELPIVFMTGNQDRNTRLWCKAVGGDEFLGKPMDETELLIRVGNLLQLRRLHRRLQATNAELERRLEERPDVTDRSLKERLAAVVARERRVDVDLERVLDRAAAGLRMRRRGSSFDRAGAFARLLAELAGFDPPTADRVAKATALRDVGMLTVPDAVVTKAGPLDADERAVLQRHTDAGRWILGDSGLELLELAASIAGAHHERWDGTGYPAGLRGKQIPIEARIAAIADALDAATSDRPYRPAASLPDALRDIADGAGSAYDPALLLSLLEAEPRLLEIEASLRPRAR